jgi:hypothetical protein
MKNLIYSAALLCLILFAASCTKGDLAQPGSHSGTGGPDCNSAPQANYTLTNTTGDSSYEIAFQGATDYTFSFPANGSATVSVKSGTYSIFIYSPGNNVNRTFSLNGQVVSKQAGARFEGVAVNSCSTSSAEISDN